MADSRRSPPSVWRNPWHFLAFGFGSGTLPKAPGTWGSLVALPFIPLLQMLPDWGYWLVLGLSMLFGFWLCGRVAEDLGVQAMVVAGVFSLPLYGYSQTLANSLD